MKIQIVDKKEDVKQMTIEELAKEKHIGFEASGGIRYLLVPIAFKESVLVHSIAHYGVAANKIDVITSHYNTGSFHIFDTARELYLWMAKE